MKHLQRGRICRFKVRFKHAFISFINLITRLTAFTCVYYLSTIHCLFKINEVAKTKHIGGILISHGPINFILSLSQARLKYPYQSTNSLMARSVPCVQNDSLSHGLFQI